MSLRLQNATANMDTVAASFDYTPKTDQDWYRLQRAQIRLQLAVLMEGGASLAQAAPLAMALYGGPEGLQRLKAIFGGLADHA